MDGKEPYINFDEHIRLTENEQVPNKYRTSSKWLCLFYSDKPRHPRQKYLLTVKGLALYNEIK